MANLNNVYYYESAQKTDLTASLPHLELTENIVELTPTGAGYTIDRLLCLESLGSSVEAASFMIINKSGTHSFKLNYNKTPSGGQSGSAILNATKADMTVAPYQAVRINYINGVYFAQ